MTSGTSWVFISGAGSGIGEAVARNLAARGMKLIVTDVDADAARRVATALSSEYEEAIWFGLDVSKPEQIEDVFSNLHRNDVCVQTAVNCAGVPGRKELLHSIDDSSWTDMQDVTLGGVFHCMRAEIRSMLRNGVDGSIVNISSVAGILGNPGSAGYTAAKHGVIGLTRAAAAEYGEKNIRINALCPGVTSTNLMREVDASDPGTIERAMSRTPLRRIAEPEEIAAAAAWLASDEASFVTGHALVVDGGMSII